MKTPVISIILPVYNAEKYLHRCIDSILAQTYTDFELLIVDDGSTDGSGHICDEYAATDSRIRVFHKANGGVASARQLGVEEAQGEYSIHVDSDDWIEPEMLTRMHAKIVEEQADILIADFYSDNGKQSYRADESTPSVKSIDILKDILTNHLFGALWNKLIRHSLYKRFNIRFIKNIDYCEDVLILVQMLQHDLKVKFLHEAYYHYDVSNLNSISRNFTSKTYQVRKRFLEELKRQLPASFHYIIIDAALEVKTQAFMYDVLPKEDFYHYLPASFKQMWHKRINNKVKLCFVLAYGGFYNLARYTFKLLVRLRGRM